MQRYDRNSIVGLSMTTVNPCNNFIIDYLIRTKIKSDKQVSSKYYMYNLAIQSVRKYPLPIICEEQLAALEGFGNFFINRVAKLMKRHYLRGRMPTQSQMEEDDKDHLDGIRQNLKRINQARKQKEEEQEKQKKYYDKKLKAVKNQQQSSNSSQKSDEQAKQYEYKDKLEQKNSNQGIQKSKQKSLQTQKFQRILFEQEQQRFKQEQSDENASDKGSKSRQKTKRNVRKNYRPRKGTQPFQILKAIIDLQKIGKTSIIKGDINQYMFNKRKQKMKGWTQVRERLVQFGYLMANANNEAQVMVTDKGRDYMYEVNNYSDSGDSSSESISHLPHKSQKTPPKKQTKPPSSASPYNKKSYTDSKKRHSKSSTKLTSKSKQKKHQKQQSNIQKQQLSIGRSYKIPTLIYNEKSEINEKDDERIFQLLSKITQFNFKDQIIHLGQFAWEIQEFLLDCLVFRFKCQSFDLDQFFLTCQRAKYVRCQNVYFVFEEALAKNVDNRRDLVNSIFADGRVAGFRMIRTSGLAQTIQFVKKITIDLIKRVRSLTSMLQSQKPMYFLGRIEEYNESLKKFKPTLVRNVAINCLKCVPNITRQMIKKIIRKMPGMWFIFKKLKQLRSNSERKKFLYWYLQQFKPRKGTIRLIVDLMFFDSYDE